jgi:Leucine-rich repeat (LRR) protein
LDGLAGLEYLSLTGTRVTDAGLVHLKSFPNLKGLWLRLEPTTIRDFVHTVLPRNDIQYQWAHAHRPGPSITTTGLAALKNNTRLEMLDLSGSQISDDSLAELGTLASLQQLALNDTPITDEGLKNLIGLKSLSILHLRKTRVSEQGVAELKRSLPRLDVVVGR